MCIDVCDHGVRRTSRTPVAWMTPSNLDTTHSTAQQWVLRTPIHAVMRTHVPAIGVQVDLGVTLCHTYDCPDVLPNTCRRELGTLGIPCTYVEVTMMTDARLARIYARARELIGAEGGWTRYQLCEPRDRSKVTGQTNIADQVDMLFNLPVDNACYCIDGALIKAKAEIDGVKYSDLIERSQSYDGQDSIYDFIEPELGPLIGCIGTIRERLGIGRTYTAPEPKYIHTFNFNDNISVQQANVVEALTCALDEVKPLTTPGEIG